MNNYRDIELIFERYRSVRLSSNNTPKLSRIIKEQYGLDDGSSTRLAILFEQAVDDKYINDIVEYLIKPAPEGGGMTPEQVAQFGQALAQVPPNQVEQWLQQTYPDVSRAMQQLNQTSASEQEEYFAEGYSQENFFIEQSWNKSVIKFLSEDVSPNSLSWRKMLFEAASNIETTSRNILLEANGDPSQNSPQVLNNFVSQIRRVLVDYKQDVPPDVARNIRSILDKVQQGKIDVVKSRGIQRGSTGTHTTAKGETRKVTVINVSSDNGRVEVKALDQSGKPVGASYSITASNFKPSQGGATNRPNLPTPTGLNKPEAPNNSFPGAGASPVSPVPPRDPAADPGSSFSRAPIGDIDMGARIAARRKPFVPPAGSSPTAPAPGTSPGASPAAPAPGASPGASPAAPASKQGFLSKLKGALGKGLTWVKNNKWKSLLYAGGLAALAGIAIASGPAVAGAAIAKIAMSKGAMLATGAGGLAGGMQAYQQSGKENKTGKDRFMSTAKGALKGAAKGFAGAMAGGLIGQGLGAAYDYFKGPQTADIGAPDPVRTIGANNPEAPDYQTAAANQAETLGPKGVDNFNQIAGASDASGAAIPGNEASAFNVGSTMDQAGANIMQILSQNGLDAQRFYDSYGQAATDLFGGDRATAYQKLADMMVQLKAQGSDDIIKELGNGGMGIGKFKQLFQSLINASFEYKGDSQLLWEAYQDITRY